MSGRVVTFLIVFVIVVLFVSFVIPLVFDNENIKEHRYNGQTEEIN